MRLTTIEQVQKRVGQLAAPRDLKVIDHIDEHAQRWLSHAGFGFIAFGTAGNIHLTAAGGQRGFALVPDAGHLRIPLAALDAAEAVAQDQSFGALFLVNGMEETLRVNGKVSHIADGQATLAVAECYLHCAKSFRRADFWAPGSPGQAPADIPGFTGSPGSWCWPPSMGEARPMSAPAVIRRTACCRKTLAPFALPIVRATAG